MIDVEKLKNEQAKLAKKVILKDDFGSISAIGGVSQISSGNQIVSAIVVCDYKNLGVIDKQYAISKPRMPYISGFRAYREAPTISEAYFKLLIKPDILIFYGNGILHPRKIGLASHMGILLDRPSIGVAKTLACGSVRGNKIMLEEKAVGEVVETKKHSKPIYVSPGHRITLRRSVDIANSCIKLPHKLPEPLHLANRYAKDISSLQKPKI